MQVVWLRATFFMASSSFPPKSTHTSATCRAGGISEEHRRKCGYICKPEHMRRENMNFKFLPLTPSSRQEWPRWAEMWWGAPRAQSSGEGTVPTTQWATVPPLPRVTSPFLLFLPHLTPAFSHLLPGWTAKGHGGSSSWGCQGREIKSQKNKQKKREVSPEAEAARHGLPSQVLDMMCVCHQVRDKGARYGGCASEEEEVFLTHQKCLPNCSVKQPTSAFPDDHPIRLQS